MANVRMFSTIITDRTDFRKLSAEVRLLYFDLCMHSDDEGFIDCAMMTGASENDIKALVSAGYLIAFESGVFAIKHWLINNTPNDGYHETRFVEEKRLVEVSDDGSYRITDNGLVDYQKKFSRVLLSNVKQDDAIVTSISEHPKFKGDAVSKALTSAQVAKQREKEAEILFEELWKLYPRKRGKGQVNRSAKIRALEIGYDGFAAMIAAYQRDMIGHEEKYIMHGSTFFNSGYVDYLEEIPKAKAVQEIEEEIDYEFAHYQ